MDFGGRDQGQILLPPRRVADVKATNLLPHLPSLQRKGLISWGTETVCWEGSWDPRELMLRGGGLGTRSPDRLVRSLFLTPHMRESLKTRGVFVPANPSSASLGPGSYGTVLPAFIHQVCQILPCLLQAPASLLAPPAWTGPSTGAVSETAWAPSRQACQMLPQTQHRRGRLYLNWRRNPGSQGPPAAGLAHTWGALFLPTCSDPSVLSHWSVPALLPWPAGEEQTGPCLSLTPWLLALPMCVRQSKGDHSDRGAAEASYVSWCPDALGLDVMGSDCSTMGGEVGRISREGRRK